MIAVLLFPLLGCGVAAALDLALPRTAGARIGMFFLLGVGAHGTLMLIGGAYATIAAYVLAILAIVMKRLPPIEEREPVIATIFIAIPLVLLLIGTAIVPLADYDGRATWLPKAQAIAHEHGVTGPFFRGERGFNHHNHYPLLLPLDAATMMDLTHDRSDHGVRWLYVLIPFAFLMVVRDRAPWFVACVAWIPMIVVAPEGSAISAYADLAVMSFCGAAVLCAAEGGGATGLWMLFLVLTKNEGTLLAVAIFVGMLLIRASRRVWISSIAGVAIGEGSLAIWRSSIPNAYDERYAHLIRDLPSHLDRILPVARAFAQHAVDFSKWGGFWIIALVAAIVTMRRNRFAIAVILVALAGYVTTFAVMNWNIDELANVSANRLLLHLAGPAMLIVTSSVGSRASAAAASGGR